MKDQQKVSHSGTGDPLAAPSRPSGAITELARILERRQDAQVLDLGPLCDGNINFFGAVGCRVFVEASEDIRRNRRPSSADDDRPVEPYELSYPDDHFDAVLLWDVMDYLDDETAAAAGSELKRVLRADSAIVILSDARRLPPLELLRRYRIESDGRLTVETIPGPTVARIPRENRELYRLFPGFEVARSTLLRTQMREILLRRDGKKA